MSRLIIVRGLPGTGKTTFAKTFGCFHVESDMYFVSNGKYEWSEILNETAHQWAYNLVHRAMFTGVDVVISNTFANMHYAERMIEKAKMLNIKVEVHTMTQQYGTIHNVPKEAQEKLRRSWSAYPGEIIH